MNTSSPYSSAFIESHDVSVVVAAGVNRLLHQLSPASKRAITQVQLVVELQEKLSLCVVSKDVLIVGMGTVAVVPRLDLCECVIHDVIVDNEHRRQGIGREILGRLINRAKRYYGAQQINLTSRPDRVEANALYVSLGFEKRDTNYYRLKM